jgi:hypothetical protein
MRTKFGIPLDKLKWTADDKYAFCLLSQEDRLTWCQAMNGQIPADDPTKQDVDVKQFFDSTAYLPARSHDPETSREAAASVDVTKREAEVLAALKDLGGKATVEQIADHLAIVNEREELGSNISPRIKPLCRKGKVEFSGEFGVSRQGKRQRVWRAI